MGEFMNDVELKASAIRPSARGTCNERRHPPLFLAADLSTREIDISSFARKLCYLRLADVAIIFYLGSMCIGNFLILISGQAVPTFAGITIILICGLCVFIAWRNHGVIDPYNWANYLIALPIFLCFSAFFAE